MCFSYSITTPATYASWNVRQNTHILIYFTEKPISNPILTEVSFRPSGCDNQFAEAAGDQIGSHLTYKLLYTEVLGFLRTKYLKTVKNNHCCSFQNVSHILSQFEPSLKFTKKKSRSGVNRWLLTPRTKQSLLTPRLVLCVWHQQSLPEQGQEGKGQRRRVPKTDRAWWNHEDTSAWGQTGWGKWGSCNCSERKRMMFTF